MADRRKYKNPPLVETIFELVVNPEMAWDPAVAGMLYERVKDLGYQVRQARRTRDLRYDTARNAVAADFQERAVFLTVDKLDLIQVGKDILTVSRLKPYQGWEVFKPRIETVLGKFQDALPELQGVSRLALRYVNHIRIPKAGFRLADWLVFRPNLEQGFSQDPESLITGCIFPFAMGKARCKVELVSTEVANPDERSFLLALEYFGAPPDGIPKGDILPWVEEAHLQIENLFEQCLTDKIRQLFGEVKS